VPDRSRPSALVVDDEPGMRDMLVHELAARGFDVVAVDGGAAAVAALRGRRFDVALSDFMMPRMDGAQVVAALKAIDPELEILVGTGYATVENAVACLKLGAFDYVRKPYDLDELGALMSRAADQGRLRGSLALYEASGRLAAAVRRADVEAVVADRAADVLRADAVVLAGPPGADRRVARFGRAAADALPVAAALAAAADERRDPFAVPTSEALAALAPCGAFTSALVYPLRSQGRRHGALCLLRASGAPVFSTTELERGSILANAVTMASENCALIAELEDRAREIARAHERARRTERLAVVGEFAAVVSHEINNPLSVVLGNAAMLEEVVADARARGAQAGDLDGVIDDVAAASADMAGAAQGIAHLVHELRRLVAVPADGARAPVLASAVVRAAMGTFCPGDEHVPVGGGAGGAAQVRVDAAEVGAAFEEIRSFLGDEEDETRPATWPVRVDARDGALVVLVQARVARLSDERIARLFDPRVRVDAASGALRLDARLAAAALLLQRNDGELAIETPSVGGTTFAVRLPLVAA
jgi:CheY-like chemotaxis protein